MKQIYLGIICGCYWLCDALELIVVASLVPEVSLEFSLSSEGSAFLGSGIFAAIGIGNACTGWLADRIGRRRTFIVSAAFTGVFGLLSALVQQLWMFVVVRIAMALALGGAPNAYNLFAESLHGSARSRTNYLISFELFWVLGVVGATAVVTALLPCCGWRVIVTVLSCPPLVLSVIACICLPESPKFLALKKDLQTEENSSSSSSDDSSDSAVAMVPLEEKENAQQQLLSPSSSDATRIPLEEENNDAAAAPVAAAGPTIVHSSSFVQQGMAKRRRNVFAPLFANKTTGRLTLLLWLIWAVDSFSYYGLVILTRSFFHRSSSSSSSSSGDAMKTEDRASTAELVETLVASSGELAGVLTMFYTLHRWGRQRTQTVGFFVSFLTTLFLVLVGRFSHSSTTPIIILVLALFSRAAVVAAYSTSWIYTMEAYSTETRGFALGVAALFSKVSSTVAPFLVSDDKSHFPVTSTAIVCCTFFIATVASFFLPFDTKPL